MSCIVITIEQGPGTDGGEPRRVMFDKAVVWLGADRTNDVVLPDAIGKRHARLERHKGRWWLVNLHGADIYVDDQRLAEPLEITRRTRAVLGDYVVALEVFQTVV